MKRRQFIRNPSTSDIDGGCGGGGIKEGGEGKGSESWTPRGACDCYR